MPYLLLLNHHSYIFRNDNRLGKRDLKFTVPDPGFPVGGHHLRRGVPTPNTAMFRRICLKDKTKELGPFMVRAGSTPLGAANGLNFDNVVY